MKEQALLFTLPLMIRNKGNAILPNCAIWNKQAISLLCCFLEISISPIILNFLQLLNYGLADSPVIGRLQFLLVHSKNPPKLMPRWTWNDLSMEQSSPGSLRQEDVLPLTAHRCTSEQILAVQIIENHQQNVFIQLLGCFVAWKTDLYVTRVRIQRSDRKQRDYRSLCLCKCEHVNSDNCSHAEICRGIQLAGPIKLDFQSSCRCNRIGRQAPECPLILFPLKTNREGHSMPRIHSLNWELSVLHEYNINIMCVDVERISTLIAPWPYTANVFSWRGNADGANFHKNPIGR